MLLASALMAGAGSAFADSEVWVRVLPNDLKFADKVVIVDLTTKVAMGNDPDEGNPPYSVTVKPSNDKVADVDITSGAITLKRRGTTDITVVYRGDNKNNYALVTYTLRVDDANDPNGTSAHPFTVSEAIQYAKDGKGQHQRGNKHGKYVLQYDL